VTERAARSRGRTIAAVVAATALVASVAVLATFAGLRYVTNEIFDNEVPSCDSDPVVLEWTRQEGGWRRSAAFQLLEDSQTVQVDVVLTRDDGGVIQTGTTIYVIAADGDLPADVGAATPTTLPFGGTVVGRGVDAVNERVTLDAGEWQLIVDGGASPAEVRWPC
jgi:hypothetical protein